MLRSVRHFRVCTQEVARTMLAELRGGTDTHTIFLLPA